MTHEDYINEFAKMTIMDNILKYILKNYNKETGIFFKNKPQNFCMSITFNNLIDATANHAYKCGVYYKKVHKWFNDKRNIYLLLSQLRKLLFLNFHIEEIDDFTEILGYNEYKRSIIFFIKITTVKGGYYNTEKWIDIGKNLRLMIQNTTSHHKYDKQQLATSIYVC